MLHLIFLGFWVSWAADWPGRLTSVWFDKDLIGLWYGLEVHFFGFFFFSLPSVVVLFRSQYFMLVLLGKWHSGLRWPPVWFLFKFSFLHSCGGGVGGLWNRMFACMRPLVSWGAVCLQQCNILLLNLNIHLIFSWRQWNSTRANPVSGKCKKKKNVTFLPPTACPPAHPPQP